MNLYPLGVTVSLGLISVAHAAIMQAPAAPPSGPSCFNFAQATDYRIIAPMEIRVKTRNSGEFDVHLSGAGCTSGKKMLSIDRAPVADICLGPQPLERLITFKREGLDPVSCRIDRVSRPALTKPEPADKKPKRS